MRNGFPVSFAIKMSERSCHRPAPHPVARATPDAGAKGSISILFVRPVVATLRARGQPSGRVLDEAGIPATLLDNPHARVSASSYSLLWRAAIRYLDDEFFGQDSRRMKPGSFALLTRSVVHCSTLGAALDRSIRFFGILLDDYPLALHRDAALAGLTIEPRADRPGSQSVFGRETLLVMAYSLACWLVRRRLPISRADFAYDAPPHAVEYLALFGPVMTFGAARTTLWFDASALRLPVIQSERTAKDFLRVAPENVLLRYKYPQGLVARIRRRLREALPHKVPELEAVAAELRIAPATLRRRLKAEGHSFQAIKDELRRDLAIALLSDTPKSIPDIASELGFGDASAFHRAFRKWTQSSPGAYRRSRPGRPGHAG